MKTHSQKFLQQRKLYMVLPLLVLPFITMIFWALGGGQGTPVQAQQMKSGLNLELPGAHFDKEDELWDKFTLYEQAKRDSLKYDEARRNDPYYVVATLRGSNQPDTVPKEANRLNTSLGSKDKYAQIEQDEELINNKLEQLTRQLNSQAQPAPNPNTRISEKVLTQSQTPITEDVDRLEKMMQIMSGTDINDPEMQQVESMLDKILDVQHPERIREKIREQSNQNKQKVFPVVAAQKDDNISLVESRVELPWQITMNDSLALTSVTARQTTKNSFYGLEDESELITETSNAIQAVVHNTQTVVAGSTIKLRLLSDVYINGQTLKKDHFIFGTCSINGERLTIEINSIRNESSLLPVALSVFDLDGMEGIYIPGAIVRDAAKQASSQSIQDVELYSMDSSIGVQAATAGIDAVKGIFSKKAKLIKVTVKAGYQVLLEDEKQIAVSSQ
jgi:conjugative transposon TraM protein